MNRSNRPKRWQLDVFMLLMIVLMILVMRAQLSSSWETAAEVAWSILTLVGMGQWVRANWAALLHEEQEQRTTSKRRAPQRLGEPARTIPLTQVQAHFLAVMEPSDRKEGA